MDVSISSCDVVFFFFFFGDGAVGVLGVAGFLGVVLLFLGFFCCCCCLLFLLFVCCLLLFSVVFFCYCLLLCCCCLLLQTAAAAISGFCCCYCLGPGLLLRRGCILDFFSPPCFRGSPPLFGYFQSQPSWLFLGLDLTRAPWASASFGDGGGPAASFVCCCL